MQIIKQTSNNTYEMTDEQHYEILESVCNIGSLLDIMYDYCEHNMANKKLVL